MDEHEIQIGEHLVMDNVFKLHECSEWTCHLFGANRGHGIIYRPLVGQEPNWFWRMTQHLILGHKWVKEQDNE